MNNRNAIHQASVTPDWGRTVGEGTPIVVTPYIMLSMFVVLLLWIFLSYVVLPLFFRGV